MPQFWLIMKGNHPSVTHARFTDESKAQKEVDRLEKFRTEKNAKIDANPATGHGSCFLNMEDNDLWTKQERTFPQ